MVPSALQPPQPQHLQVWPSDHITVTHILPSSPQERDWLLAGSKLFALCLSNVPTFVSFLPKMGFTLHSRKIKEP